MNKGKRPLWHRRRASTGADWSPSKLADFEVRDKGFVCTECHKRVPYKDMDCVYELHSGELFRTWICGFCGRVLKEDSIDEMEQRFEDERSPFGAGY